jgi:hypothetical protein
MDLNNSHFPLTLVALQVQFGYRSKTELRSIIVRDQGEFPKSSTEICGFIFIYDKGLY